MKKVPIRSWNTHIGKKKKKSEYRYTGLNVQWKRKHIILNTIRSQVGGMIVSFSIPGSGWFLVSIAFGSRCFGTG